MDWFLFFRSGFVYSFYDKNKIIQEQFYETPVDNNDDHNFGDIMPDNNTQTPEEEYEAAKAGLENE